MNRGSAGFLNPSKAQASSFEAVLAGLQRIGKCFVYDKGHEAKVERLKRLDRDSEVYL